MSHPNSNLPEALQQGITWLKSERNQIIELFTSTLVNLPRPGSGAAVPDEPRWRLIATKNIDGVIERLESGIYQREEVEEGFAEPIAIGVPLQRMAATQDKMQALLSEKIEHDLASQPPVRDILLQKIAYFYQLVKASMAAALINSEAHKAPGGSPKK